MADQAITLIETIDTETSNIDTLATTLDTLFRRHPHSGDHLLPSPGSARSPAPES